METFEWQQRDESTTLIKHIIAGSCAGISQHLSMLPLDNIKTHCQAGSHLPIRSIIANIYHHGGIANFYSGSMIVAIGCVPAHAMYFAVFEKLKKILNCNAELNSIRFCLVGPLSSLFHDCIMNPTEVLKQRLQLLRTQGSNQSLIRLIGKMYKNQGLISFYRSFGINYLMSIPFSSILIFSNQKLKRQFKARNNSFYYYLCGGIAGAIASIPTCPLDVIKTKLNTQACLENQCEKKIICEIHQNKKILYEQQSTRVRTIMNKAFQNYSQKSQNKIKYRNIIDTSYTIFKEQGLQGFFQGLKMRIIIQSFSSAVAWGTYQTIKNFLNSKIIE